MSCSTFTITVNSEFRTNVGDSKSTSTKNLTKEVYIINLRSDLHQMSSRILHSEVVI